MKIATLIARNLLGLLFLVFGLNGFLHFIPQPPPPAGTRHPIPDGLVPLALPDAGVCASGHRGRAVALQPLRSFGPRAAWPGHRQHPALSRADGSGSRTARCSGAGALAGRFLQRALGVCGPLCAEGGSSTKRDRSALGFNSPSAVAPARTNRRTAPPRSPEKTVRFHNFHFHDCGEPTGVLPLVHQPLTPLGTRQAIGDIS